MSFNTNPETLPDLTLVDGESIVSHSTRTADPALVAAESAIVTNLCSRLGRGVEKTDTEEAALESVLKSFGFGPMFTII